ncbi:hypothetical protein GmRootV213_51380 (plasmid) [Variovorax sp. V213]|uniref:DUF2169 family type VI secretion system accessory protein n=1 Tax=Variovorax sp. V213 TaxID=3065955 RepID=UPI0034E8AFB5
MSVPSVPPPRLQQVRNLTSFGHFQYDKMGPGKCFHDIVIVCASFVLAAGRLEAAPMHRGPVFADTAWDAVQPVLSSLRSATDLVLVKPEADVFVTGSARARDWTPRRDWLATLEVARGDTQLLSKSLRLTGPRAWHWHDDPAQRAPSDPQPVLEVPLRYELAFGGWWFDAGDAPDAPPRTDAANPCGSGRFGSACRDTHPRARYDRGAPVPAPQIEGVDAPIAHGNQDGLVPAGFGPIARHWQPRLALAGTYDDAWLQRHAQAPFMDYAEDFDPRFFQYAPADQRVAQGLVGDERLRLAGFFASTDALEMQLPDVRIEALCRCGDGSESSESMKLDTVHIDLDEMLVHLTWRLTLDQARDVVGVDLLSRNAEADRRRHHEATEGASA